MSAWPFPLPENHSGLYGLKISEFPAGLSPDFGECSPRFGVTNLQRWVVGSSGTGILPVQLRFAGRGIVFPRGA
jgi:hypothetical protein